MLSLVNTERTNAGCSPLRRNGDLAQAAEAHSRDMATRDYFDHTSLEGTTSAQRARAAGYPSGFVGENIAAGQRDAADVMRSWMNSPGHRANILNCDYVNLGVGYVAGGSYGHYWTQVFGG